MRGDLPSRAAHQAGGGARREPVAFRQVHLRKVWSDRIDRQYEMPFGRRFGKFSAHQRPGNLPSVPRVPSWLKSRSLREWTVICKAVTDARKELFEDLGPSEKVRFDLNHMPAASGSYS